MTKTAEMVELPETAEEIKARAAEAGLPVDDYIHRALVASNGGLLTGPQLYAVVTALPQLDLPSSAEDIRELRGPLPDHD